MTTPLLLPLFEESSSEALLPPLPRWHGEQRIAALALALTPQIGIVTIERLIRAFDTPVAALLAHPDKLQTLKIAPGTITAIQRSAQQIATLRQTVASWTQDDHPIRHVLWTDHPIDLMDRAESNDNRSGIETVVYPDQLRALRDRPPALFWRGALPPTGVRPFGDTVAIVGTRQPSADGLAVAHRYATSLAEQQITVISGLAYGIDHAAHHAALRVDNGRSIAILGSGLLRVYPVQHSFLSGKIEQRGAVLSEVHPDQQVSPGALVVRNRLIAAFADRVIVVETSATGGAMHCARRALASGRPVFVWENGGTGCIALLKEGAQPLSAQPLSAWP